LPLFVTLPAAELKAGARIVVEVRALDTDLKPHLATVPFVGPGVHP
jgi:hypothetical protein